MCFPTGYLDDGNVANSVGIQRPFEAGVGAVNIDVFGQKVGCYFDTSLSQRNTRAPFLVSGKQQVTLISNLRQRNASLQQTTEQLAGSAQFSRNRRTVNTFSVQDE